MYKIKQKFTIEYEIDMQLSKHEFHEFGFNDYDIIKSRLIENLSEIKKEVGLHLLPEKDFKITTLKTSAEIDNESGTDTVIAELDEEREV